MKKFFLLILIAEISVFVGFTQNLTIETEIDTNRITIGDQIKLKYLIKHQKDLEIQLPVLNQNITDGIEIIGEPLVVEKEINNETKEKGISYTITAFDTGMYYIPPLPFLVKSGLYADTVFSKETYLEVLGVALDTTYTVRDIKGVEKVPLSFAEILPFLLGLLVLGLIGFIIYSLFVKEKETGKTILKRVRPEEPPYYVALRELDKLKAEKVWQQKRTKEYYTRLTTIVRTYIEKRFIIPALEETSSEILNDIQSMVNLNHDTITILRELLNLADLVKFAKGEPLPEDNIRLLDNAYQFLKNTKPVEEPTENNKTESN